MIPDLPYTARPTAGAQMLASFMAPKVFCISTVWDSSTRFQLDLNLLLKLIVNAMAGKWGVEGVLEGSKHPEAGELGPYIPSL